MDTAHKESKPLHAGLFVQDFQVSEDHRRVCYFYTLTDLALYGLLSPCEIVPSCPAIFSYRYKIQLSNQQINKLIKFQDLFWRAVTFTSTSGRAKPTDVTLLIVPIQEVQPDFQLIEKINSGKAANIWSDKQVLRHKNGSLLCELLHKLNLRSPAEEFLSNFLGEDHEDFEKFKLKYKNKRTSDLIHDQSFPFPVVQSFLLSLKKTNSNDETCICIVKQMQAAYSKTKANNVNNKKVVLFSVLEPHPLTVQHWNEATLLLKTLFRIEQYSFVTEFSLRFEYKASSKYLIQASTLPVAEPTKNYDPIETIGDCLLKVLTSFQLFIEHPTYSEKKMTNKRGYIVSNEYLTCKSEEFDLSRYFLGRKIPITKYRPPYYTGYMMNEMKVTTELISTKMKADILEAHIGAFYLGEGVYSALLYIYKLKILKPNDQVSQYLTNGNLSILSKEWLLAYSFPRDSTISDMFSHPSQDLPSDLYELGDFIGYSFKDIRFLRQALTHGSMSDDDYERFEFLGDAIFDFVVLCNLHALDESLTAEELTHIKHSMVKNSTMSKFSVLLQLDKFLIASSDVIEVCEDSAKNLDWSEKLAEFGHGTDCPHKIMGDIFESVVAAILLDSKDFAITVRIVANWIKFILIYMVQNKAVIKQYSLKLFEKKNPTLVKRDF